MKFTVTFLRSDILEEQELTIKSGKLNIRIIQLKNYSDNSIWKAVLKLTLEAKKMNKENFSVFIGNDIIDEKSIVNCLDKLKEFNPKIYPDLILHNVCDFIYAVPISRKEFWIDRFSKSSFFTISSTMYDKILNTRDEQNDQDAFLQLSKLSPYKIVTFPFIVKGKDISDNGAYKLNLFVELMDKYNL